MAMTAWSAKVVTSSICFSVNGLISIAPDHEDADGLVVAHERHGKHRPVAEVVRHTAADREFVGRCLQIVNVNRHTFNEGAPGNHAPIDRPLPDIHGIWTVMRR